MKKKEPYKAPVFLFTSGSMRKAAWAGWYSAFGDEKNAEEWVHQAYSEWAKELGGARNFPFVDRFNHDIYQKIDFAKLKELTDKYLLDLKREIRRGIAAGKSENRK